MILYLSSGIEREVYADLFSKGIVGASLQAQRFNSLVIEGIGCSDVVYAVGHPSYSMMVDNLSDINKIVGNIHYCILGYKKGVFRRVNNIIHLYKLCRLILQKNKVDAIVCDAISPLYSFVARLLSKRKKIPSIAIVTDIPIIMDAAHPSLITKVSQYLVHKHDGYVLLTEAMNKLVNLKNKPYIIMEGLCEQDENIQVEKHSKRDVNKEKGREKEIILYTGSLALQTGIENLVEAFKKLTIHDVELWIYGGGKAEDYVKEQAKDNSNIYFGGLVDNEAAAALQRKADILVNPRPTTLGYAEYSFPSKIMEYMASGTPVVTTKLPGIPSEYFDYLYTFEDDSVEGILESLENVLRIDHYQRDLRGKQAKDFVSNNKNKKKQGERIIKLSKQISTSK